MKKKLIASILAALMVTSLVPASAFANTGDAATAQIVTIGTVDATTAAGLAAGVDKIPSEGYVAVADKDNVKAVLKAVEKTASKTVRDEFKETYPDKADQLTKTVAKLKTLLVNEASTALTKVTVVAASELNQTTEPSDNTGNAYKVYKALQLYDELNDDVLGNLQNDLSRASSDKADALNSLKTGGTYATNVTELEKLDAAKLTSDGAGSTTSYNDATEYAANKTKIKAFYDSQYYTKLPAAQRDLLKCVDTVDKAANAVEKFEKEDEAIKTELNKLDDLKLDTTDRIANAKTVLAAVEAALEDANTDLNNYKTYTVKVAGETTDPEGATAIIQAVKDAIKKAEKTITTNTNKGEFKKAAADLLAKASSDKGIELTDLGALYDLAYMHDYTLGLTASNNDSDINSINNTLRNKATEAIAAATGSTATAASKEAFEDAVISQFLTISTPVKAENLKDLHKAYIKFQWGKDEIWKTYYNNGTGGSATFQNAVEAATAQMKQIKALADAGEAKLSTPGETDTAKQGLVQKVQTLVGQVETNAAVGVHFERDLAAAKSAHAALSDYEKSLEKDWTYYFGMAIDYSQAKYQVEIDSDKSTSTPAEKVSITDAFAYIDKLVAGEDANKKAKDDADRIAIAIEALPGVTVTGGTASITDFSKLTKEAVYKVKDMYDAASKEAKGYFKVGANPDYSTWKTALDAAVKAIDGTVVKDLNDSIAALTIVKEDAPAADVAAAKKANKEARDAYDALTDSQKAEVNITKLERAEAAVAAAELYAVKEQLKEIAKLDFDKLTKEDAAKIEAAKAAVDALTDAQKASLKDTADYKTFTDKALPALAAAYDLAKATVAPIDAVTYNAKEQTPAVKITNSLGAELTENEDFVVYYTNNKNAGEATVTIEGRGEYEKTKTEAKFTINPRQLNKDTASLAYVANKAYTGKAIKQTSAAVKWANKIALNKGYYTLSYKNNTKVGTATITATGRGNYAGTISKTFKINPAKEAVTVTKGTKKFTAKAAVAQSGVKYQFAWKASTAKTWKTWKTKYTTKTVTGLKSGKTYQVKVRAIKTVNGQTYYGAYSNVKSVKVK